MITLYIDDILIISETEKQPRTELNPAMTHTDLRGWLTNPANTGRTDQTVKCLGII